MFLTNPMTLLQKTKSTTQLDKIFKYLKPTQRSPLLNFKKYRRCIWWYVNVPFLK